ncbi:hypothetical protein [Mesorhizobium sp. CN2-181]|uniref:hypothetical protein n=1 Tax=Mesorhizobium yinganensis TaxID=3157707 RepID=UPI0032B771CC
MGNDRIQQAAVAGMAHSIMMCEQAAELIHASDSETIGELERRFGFSQADAVTHFIEQTEWGIEMFPHFQDRKGSSEDRLASVRSNWSSWESA